MTGVLLRCPNCGTTKASFGECEACHEAQVRYFCTNHSPGQWLESPKCTLCGAVFGRVSPAPSPSPSPMPGPRPERSPSPAGPASTRPAPRTPRPDGSRSRRREDGDWHGEAPGPRDMAEPPELRRGGGVLLPGLEEILRAAARRRVPREPEREAVPVRRGMGCLTRLLLMALFFILSLVASMFVTAGSIFQMFRF